jgi:hypothetical protein
MPLPQAALPQKGEREALCEKGTLNIPLEARVEYCLMLEFILDIKWTTMMLPIYYQFSSLHSKP